MICHNKNWDSLELRRFEMKQIEEVYAYLDKNQPEIAQKICYASEILLSELDKALEVLKQKRVEAAKDDDDDKYDCLTKYRDILKDYKSNINAYLDYNTKHSKTETFLQSPEEVKSPVDYAQYRVDSNKPHLLDENFTHARICAFLFRKVKIAVNDWTDALITLCNKIAQISPDFFSSLVNSSDFQGRKVQYFSFTYVEKRSIKILGTNVYVWTNLSANAIAKLIENILTAFGENPNEFYVYLRADYTALHYNNVLSESEIVLKNEEEKIGKYVQRCMRELESKGHIFTSNELLALLDASQSKDIFGITYPFFIDDKSKIYGKDMHLRYWKAPFLFNGKYYYITSQWYEHHREKFNKWFELIKDSNIN